MLRRNSRFVLPAVVFVATCFAGTLAAQSVSRQIPSSGTGVFAPPDTSSPSPDGPELDPALSTAESSDAGNDAVGQVTLNRTVGNGGKGHGDKTNGSRRAKSNPVVNSTIDGLNLYQQRYADAGNQFTVEPPDQGLCAGNGFVLESVNDVLRVFDTAGSALIQTVSLNKFYGYPSAINRRTGAFGPSLTDPTCLFDQETQRWFHVVLTLDRIGTRSALAGSNHLDLAVSQTADPLGQWTIYRIPVQNDGTAGTPNHNCNGPCLGDYPHIGADTNGIYLTTNEFSLFHRGYFGSQIYALSKQALVSGAANVNLVQYNTNDASINSASGLPGFTVWPAISSGESASEQGGTEYLLSSLAVFQDSGSDNRLQLWSLTNTSALNTSDAPTLTSSLVATQGYGIPDLARQPGSGTDGVGKSPTGGNIDFPLGQCLNTPSCSTKYILGRPDPFTESIRPLAASDSRMQQVFYANGKLWSSLGTGVSYDGVTYGSSGIAYFILHPHAESGTPTASVVRQGYVAAPDIDVTYGTVAVTNSGRGVISFTATGPATYPSAGFASLDAKIGAGDIQIASPGQGVNDGFSGYRVFGSRPRWGDYGAAAVDGKSIWFAQEYTPQTCTLPQYISSAPFGSCSATRAALGNWGTRIVQVTP